MHIDWRVQTRSCPKDHATVWVPIRFMKDFFKVGFFFFFNVGHFFLKVFIEFVIILFLFYVLVFWLRGMWILATQPGIESAPLALEGEVLTTWPPGKSLYEGFWFFASRKLLQKVTWSRLNVRHISLSMIILPFLGCISNSYSYANDLSQLESCQSEDIHP